jgi:hypothetical protein
MALDPVVQESTLESTGRVEQEDDVPATCFGPTRLIHMLGVEFSMRIDDGHRL